MKPAPTRVMRQAARRTTVFRPPSPTARPARVVASAAAASTHGRPVLSTRPNGPTGRTRGRNPPATAIPAGMRTMSATAARIARIRTPRDRSSGRRYGHRLDGPLQAFVAPSGVERVDTGEDRAFEERPRQRRRDQGDRQPDERSEGDDRVLVPQVQRVRGAAGEAEDALTREAVIEQPAHQ